MTKNLLGFAGARHQTARTRHGWSKALQLTPDLYPGVGGKRLRATLLERAYAFAGGRSAAPALIVDAVEMLHAGSLVLDDFDARADSRVAAVASDIDDASLELVVKSVHALLPGCLAAATAALGTTPPRRAHLDEILSRLLVST
jgi:hypothetical protein